MPWNGRHVCPWGEMRCWFRTHVFQAGDVCVQAKAIRHEGIGHPAANSHRTVKMFRNTRKVGLDSGFCEMGTCNLLLDRHDWLGVDKRCNNLCVLHRRVSVEKLFAGLRSTQLVCATTSARAGLTKAVLYQHVPA